MAGKSATFENDLLKLIFNGAGNNIANIADNAATSPLTNLYVALHITDPTDAGTQTSGEISYTGYARVAVARTTGGWTVSGSTVTPVANIDFGAMTAGAGGTVGWWSVGVASSGSTKILYLGTVSPTIAVTNGVTPRLTTATNIVEG